MAVTYSTLVPRTGALLTFGSKSVQKSTHNGVVYAKSVRESVQTSYIPSLSSTSSFHKIQIFKFAYSALSLFYSLFRFKIITAWCCIYEKRRRIGRDKLHIVTVFEELVLQKYRFSNLHILHVRCFIPCLGSKSLLHGVVYPKSVKELEEI